MSANNPRRNAPPSARQRDNGAFNRSQDATSATTAANDICKLGPSMASDTINRIASAATITDETTEGDKQTKKPSPCRLGQATTRAQLHAFAQHVSRSYHHGTVDIFHLPDTVRVNVFYALARNIALLGFDDAALDEILAGLEDGDTSGFGGGGGDGEASSQAGAPGALAERFGVPPFSVLDARKGWWQDRKRAWIDLGIRSELGRGAAPGGSPRPLDRAKANAAPGGSPLPAADYVRSKARGDGRGRAM